MNLAQYLLGTVSLILWVFLILFSAWRLAGRLLPASTGTASAVATLLLATSLGLLTAILPGLVGLLTPIALLAVALLLAVSVALFVPAPGRNPSGWAEGEGRAGALLTLTGALVGGLASAVFMARTLERIDTGMTGFDSTWYHGPIAAEFIETGDVFALHVIAPQFLTWFYPHNSELIHAAADMLFGGDLPSLAIGLVWFGACLLAGWAIGGGRSVGPLSLAGVALAIGSFAFADQAGEARNDLAGTFFLLAGIGVATSFLPKSDDRRVPVRGIVFVVGLAAGLAAGTKLNFLLPGLVLGVGAVFLAERADRRGAILPALAGLFAGGSFWYLRNLLQAGNPLPWTSGIGPIPLPAPDQERGGRDPGSVLEYLDDPGILVDPFVPDLWTGFGDAWPVLLVLAVAGLVLSVIRLSERALFIGGLTGIAALIAWLAGPTSASGPEGDPVGFLSGLRYLVPALAIGLALLGPAFARISPGAVRIVAALFLIMAPFTLLDGLSAGALTALLVIGATALFGAVITALARYGPGLSGRTGVAIAVAITALVVPVGYLVQVRYEENRYASPEFVEAGLARAFVWAREVEGDSIGTTATRSYPLYGKRFDNRVAFIGIEGPNGGFVRPEECRPFIEAVNRGEFDWVVASLDRVGAKRDYPPEVRWLDRDPAADPLFRAPPTAVFAIEGRLDPDLCPGA